MKISNHFRIFILLMAAFIFASVVAAQDSKPTDGQAQDGQNPAQDTRGEMLRQLGLTREQLQQIRRVNQERKPLMDEAQKRFREANRALDEAIYGDQVSESDVQARLKEVQIAQAEVARIRYTNELSVRRILTPDQLVRFREMRRKFNEENRENLQKKRALEGGRKINGQTTVNNGEKPTRRVVRPNQQRPNL